MKCALRTLAAAIGGICAFLGPAQAQTPEARIIVDSDKVINRITPLMTGSCIEDVNHEIYGGLYDQRIFGESFEEPAPSAPLIGWTTYGGLWSAADSICHAAASQGGKLVLSGPDVADATIDADVQLADDRGGNAGLLVRVRNPGVGADTFDGYEISLSAQDQRVILGKHRHNWQPIATASCALSAGQWQHLQIQLQGARIRVAVNGAAAPQIDFTDRDAPLLTGTIALRSWNADAQFRQLRLVSEPDGAVLTPPIQQSADSLSLSGMWDAIRTGTAPAQYLCDASAPFQGRFSQKITQGIGTGTVGIANRGLNRWGIAVHKGQRFEGHLYLRGSGTNNRVTVALQSAEGKTTYATALLTPAGDQWGRSSFTLTSTVTDNNARFALWLDKPGTVWVDQIVLMDEPAHRFHRLPIRADIAHALVAEGVTFLRYGGTMVNVPGYRWKNMIGDPDRRPPYHGNWYPYSTNGFGIFDFLNFCEAAHIEAAFAIDIEETDSDAADLADYLTAPAETPWGRKRAADGHPKPYHVRYIEIGNEEVLGSDSAPAYAHYAERFRALAHAIHSRNPTLPLVCAAWWRPDSPNIKPVFDAVNGEAAAWDLHVWSDAPTAGRDIDRQITQMQTLFQTWNPQSAMKAVIFEENGNLHDLPRALGHATTLNASRRHGDFVLADCPANCLQPLGQNDNGWDQGQIFFTPDRVWGMPPYFAQQMAARNYEPLHVESRVEAAPDLDVLATRSEDGRTLVLSITNTGSRAQSTTIDLGTLVNTRWSGQSWTLDPESPFATTTIKSDMAGRPSEKLTVSHPFTYRFPANSYTILRLSR